MEFESLGSHDFKRCVTLPLLFGLEIEEFMRYIEPWETFAQEAFKTFRKQGQPLVIPAGLDFNKAL